MNKILPCAFTGKECWDLQNNLKEWMNAFSTYFSSKTYFDGFFSETSSNITEWMCLDMSCYLYHVKMVSINAHMHTQTPHRDTHVHKPTHIHSCRSIYSNGTMRVGEKSGIHEDEGYRCQDCLTHKDPSGNWAAHHLMLLQISGSGLVGRRSVLTLTDSRGKQCCMQIIQFSYSYNCILLKCDVKVQSNMLFQCKWNTKLDECN